MIVRIRIVTENGGEVGNEGDNRKEGGLVIVALDADMHSPSAIGICRRSTRVFILLVLFECFKPSNIFTFVRK